MTAALGKQIQQQTERLTQVRCHSITDRLTDKQTVMDRWTDTGYMTLNIRQMDRQATNNFITDGQSIKQTDKQTYR